jgi:2-aminoadipate transaminase
MQKETTERRGDTDMIHFARRMKHMNRSEIREILKVTENPEIISFAGGLPASEAFPVEELREAVSIVLETAGTKALQYSLAEGLPSLRRKIAERSCKLWMRRPHGGCSDRQRLPAGTGLSREELP